MSVSIRIASLPVANIEVELRKTGLAFVGRVASPVEIPSLPEVTVTFLLWWGEVALIAALFASGSLIVHYRSTIAGSWLISQWAPAHLSTAAGLITIFAFLVGWLVAVWKKEQLFTYSMGEMAFGLFSIFQIALHFWPKGELSAFVGLASAVYVVSRGAGNLWDAFVNEAKLQRGRVEVALGTK